MTNDDRWMLVDALERLREVRNDIGDAHAGVAVLHLEATIAALESQLRRYELKAA